MAVDKNTRFRVLLEIAEERATDPTHLARAKIKGVEDARWFIDTMFRTCGHLEPTPRLTADIEQAAANHVVAISEILGAEGFGSPEIGAFQASFGLGVDDHIRTLQAATAEAAVSPRH